MGAQRSKKSNSPFLKALSERQPKGCARWVYVPYDQLSERIGPLSREKPDSVGIVLIESTWKPAQRPYHKQKLALVLANMRHFALEQAKRGVSVRYVFSDRPYSAQLRTLASTLGPITMMEAAERELREDLAPLVKSGALIVEPHEGWLSSREDFLSSQRKGPPWRMDSFYRHLRKKTGLLMEGKKPIGGKYSHDADNRRPWPGEPEAPSPPRFVPDPITKEVLQLVEERFADHPGALDGGALPATASNAKRLWDWAKRSCMEHFGPYEDAMSARSTGLFHTRISALMHLHRLLPKQVVNDVATMDIPLPSKEGFIRQVLGWREFMRHVHRETDGLRMLPGQRAPNALGAKRALPAAFWGEVESGLACLDRVVKGVWAEGYSHHITRLMVLSNIAALLDVDPRALTDWFWVAYIDAFDWVVEPNVLGMGTFSTGPLMTTKPYVSGAGYIHKMSDYCKECQFHPKKNCPLTPMYWAYLERHKRVLGEVQRMSLPLASMKKRSKSQREADRAVFAQTSEALFEGRPLQRS